MAQHYSDSNAFSVGKGGRIGNISLGGNVAGRDVVVTTTTSTGDAASDNDLKPVLEALASLQDQIAKLEQAPPGLRDDAQDELRKAQQAGSLGDTQRLAEKLGAAKGYLERIGQHLPEALSLAQTVAMLATRVAGVS